VTSEFKAQNESGYCGEVRHETGCDKPVTLCIHRLDRCVFCADYIDERTNESERKPYFSHSAMKDVGEGKCENGHKKYSQALGSTNLICSKGHVVFLHFTPTTRIWAYANARTHTHNHVALISFEEFHVYTEMDCRLRVECNCHWQEAKCAVNSANN